MAKKEGEAASNSSQKNTGDKAISPNDKLIAKRQELDAIIKKADYYVAKSSVVDIDLYYIVKDFFKAFLDLKYEFSFDELLLELDKIYLDSWQRESISNFILKIKLIEYDDRSFDKEEIKGYIKEFSGIAKVLLKNVDSEKETFWTKLQKALGGKKKQIIGNLSANGAVSPNSVVTQNIKDLHPPDISEEKEGDLSAEKTAETEQVYSSAESSNYLKNKDAADAQDYLKKNIVGDYASSKDVFLSKTEQDVVLNNKLKYSSISSDNTKYVTYIPKNTQKPQDYKNRKKDESKIESWTSDPLMEGKYKSNNVPDDTSWIKPIDELPIDDENNGENKSSDKSKKDVSSKEIKQIKQGGQGKKERKTKQSSKSEDDIFKLIEKAKKLRKKSDLLEIYKKINSKYDSSDVGVQAKYYKELVNIYNRISKLK